jgi:hypothetical protein
MRGRVSFHVAVVTVLGMAMPATAGPVEVEGPVTVTLGPTGDASCEGDACAAASGTGNASCDGRDRAAVSGTGNARCDAPYNQYLLDDTCYAVSGTGDADRPDGGLYAFSLAGDCYDRRCFAVAPLGEADGFWLGVSATGSSHGVVAASLLEEANGTVLGASAVGDAEGFVAVSGTGDADCDYVGFACFVAVSGTGQADDRARYSVSGCETAEALCVGGPATLP